MEQPQRVVIEAQSTNKNDGKTTILGLLLALCGGAMDYFMHAGQDGVDYGAPTFWIGLAISVLIGLKGYYTNKTGAAVVAQPVGQNPTVNVDVKP